MNLIVARNPSEFQSMQAQTAEAMRQAAQAARSEAQENNADDAPARYLATKRLKGVAKKQAQFARWAERVANAIDAGYAMLPNLDGSVIAVRISENRKAPYDQGCREWRTLCPDEPRTFGLGDGKGKYVNPENALGKRTINVPDGKGGWKSELRWFNKALRIARLPFRMERSEVVAAVDSAMGKRIFDEIVAVPKGHQRDPIIFGRVIDDSGNLVSAHLIVWWVDRADFQVR